MVWWPYRGSTNQAAPTPATGVTPQPTVIVTPAPAAASPPQQAAPAQPAVAVVQQPTPAPQGAPAQQQQRHGGGAQASQGPPVINNYYQGPYYAQSVVPPSQSQPATVVAAPAAPVVVPSTTTTKGNSEMSEILKGVAPWVGGLLFLAGVMYLFQWGQFNGPHGSINYTPGSVADANTAPPGSETTIIPPPANRMPPGSTPIACNGKHGVFHHVVVNGVRGTVTCP